MENCRGCGSLLDPGHAHVGGAAGAVRESARPAAATGLGRECPLCGQPTAPPVFYRKSVQFALLAGLLVVTSLLVLFHYLRGDTERQPALQQLEASPEVTRLLGSPEHAQATVESPRWSGAFPCVWAVADGSAPRLGECTPPVPIAALRSGPIDRFEVDLRFGKFVLRQTDLLLEDGDLQVPLTRTYTSQLWPFKSSINAFGVLSRHDFDVAPVGSRSPYTYLAIVQPDGELLYFPRISRGGGYADAVYRHSETATSLYKAVIRWDGEGWETRLDDGSLIRFPESYHAKNYAQGAPTMMVDAKGNQVELLRDPQRNLLAVRTPGGRRLAFDYDGRDCVVRAADDRGRSVRYRYNPDALLTDVAHPDGRARRYAYAGTLLTDVRDERGRMLVRNWYDEAGRVVRQVHADGATYQFRYRMAANKHYAEEATVVLPGGATRSFPTGDSVTRLLRDLKP